LLQRNKKALNPSSAGRILRSMLHRNMNKPVS